MRHQKLIGIFAIAIFALNLVIPLYAQVEEGERCWLLQNQLIGT